MMWVDFELEPGFLRGRSRSPLAERSFTSIRGAVAAGNNAGSFAVTTHDVGVVLFRWRLLGDDVEFKRAGEVGWALLDPGDLGYAFSGGVRGRVEHWAPGDIDLGGDEHRLGQSGHADDEDDVEEGFFFF